MTTRICYQMPFRALALRDWEDFGERDVSAYFDNVYGALSRHLDLIRRLERPVNHEEMKELHFMLDALFEAREVWR